MKKAEVREGLIDLSETSTAFAALDKWQKKRVRAPIPACDNPPWGCCSRLNDMRADSHLSNTLQDAVSDGTAAATEPAKPRGNGVFNAEELANLTVGSAKAAPAPKQAKKPKVHPP